MTIADAGRHWLHSVEADIERTTYEQYEQHLRLHIVPFLGSTKLTQFTVAAAKQFRDRLRKGDPTITPDELRKLVSRIRRRDRILTHEDLRRPPRSPAMVRGVMASLGALLAEALESEFIARNVVREMRRGGKKGKTQVKRQKRKLKVGVDIPTPDETRKMLAAARELADARLKDLAVAKANHRDDPSEENQAKVKFAELRLRTQVKWRVLLMTVVFTGPRASELRGLHWDDVDLDKNPKLHIRQRADRYNVIGKPKSAAGYREIPLTPTVSKELREWKLLCPRKEGDKLGFVFPNQKGNIDNLVNMMSRGIVPIMKAAKITKSAGIDGDGNPIVKVKYGGLHMLRHFFASWCINREADGGLELPPKVVQERLGHSSITMTMDTYGHLFPRGDDAAELAAAEKRLLG
jgi:integrase